MFNLGRVGLILGVAWLATLGEIKANWQTLSMSFIHQVQNMIIQGDPKVSKAMISSKALKKLDKAKVDIMSML